MYNCFLTVRLKSSRLKEKALLKLGKLTFIEHSIVRCKKNNLTPIICTTKKKEDKIFKKIANTHKIKIFFGSEKNKMKRWLDCAKFFNLKKFHTLDVDDPFFDTESVKKSLSFLNNKLKPIYLVCPSRKSRAGGASEGYSFFTDYLEKILIKKKLLSDFANTEMIDKIIEDFNKLTLSNSIYETKKNYRMTLDYQEDFEFLKIIYYKFSHYSQRKKINKFLDKNYFLRKINFFRNKEWKQNQIKIIKKQ